MVKRFLLVFLALLIGASVNGPQPASAQDKVFYYAAPQDYTKIYTFLSKVWEQSFRDYITLVNLRGGVEGYRFEILTGDHANEPQRGIELYEQYKNKGAIIIDTVSTPVAHAVLPRCMKDGIILYTPYHGRGDAVIGEVFPWVFPLGATYTSKSIVLLEYIYNQEGKNLKGKKIAYVHIDTAFGREVLPVLTRLSQKLDFELRPFGYPPPGNEQSSIWTQIRLFKPDWVILWSAGIGQSVSVKEALRNGIPIDRITSCDWLLEHDMNLIGAEQGKGAVRVEGVAPGREPAIIQEILKEVYSAGKGAGDEKIVGTSLYNVGAGLSTAISEVIRIAIRKYGEPLTADKARAAFEQIKDFNCGGTTASCTTSPTDHEGGGGARVARWNGQKFEPISDWYVSRFRDTYLEVARESAAKYKAEGNPLKEPSIVVK